jgi:hypothetical protein
MLTLPSVHDFQSGTRRMQVDGECEGAVVVERATHETILKHVHSADPREIGGPFTFVPNDQGGFTLHSQSANQNRESGFAVINIPRGVVEFHTHPSRCQASPDKSGDVQCTVALPSAADMVNVAVGFRDGVRAHLLYTSEGVYVIQVSDALAAVVSVNADDSIAMCRLQKLLCDMYTQLEDNHRAYARKVELTQGEKAIHAMFHVHQAEWMRLAHQLGFRVQLVAPDELPRLNLHSKTVCGVKPSSFTPIVHLNTEWLMKNTIKCGNEGVCEYLKEQLRSTP